MGKPTGTFNDQDDWEAFNESFTAFYDAYGNVTQLDDDSDPSPVTHCEGSGTTPGAPGARFAP